MVGLFTGPYSWLLILAEIALFAWLFLGLAAGTSSRAGGLAADEGRILTPNVSAGSRAFDEDDAPPRSARGSTRTSQTFEMWFDREAGEERARIVDGPFRGRKIEALSRTECFRLHEYCRFHDPVAAQWLEGYIHRRFTGGGRAKPRESETWQWESRRHEPRRPRPADGPMSREEALQALGLAPDAGPEAIVKAHRALIKRHHPDHGGSHDAAARINRAKDVLMARSG